MTTTKPDFHQSAIELVKEAVPYWEKRVTHLKSNLQIAESELKYLQEVLSFFENLNLEELEDDERSVAVERVFEIIGKLQKRKDRYGKDVWSLRRY